MCARRKRLKRPRFDPEHVPWHKHWWLGAPTDYWVAVIGVTLIVLLINRRPRGAAG